MKLYRVRIEKLGVVVKYYKYEDKNGMNPMVAGILACNDYGWTTPPNYDPPTVKVLWRDFEMGTVHQIFDIPIPEFQKLCEDNAILCAMIQNGA